MKPSIFTNGAFVAKVCLIHARFLRKSQYFITSVLA